MDGEWQKLGDSEDGLRENVRYLGLDQLFRDWEAGQWTHRDREGKEHLWVIFDNIWSFLLSPPCHRRVKKGLREVF